jgi:hypothetical protein
MSGSSEADSEGNDHRGRIKAKKPAGHRLPEAFQQDLEGGRLQRTTERYVKAAKLGPLRWVVDATEVMKMMLQLRA